MVQCASGQKFHSSAYFGRFCESDDVFERRIAIVGKMSSKSTKSTKSAKSRKAAEKEQTVRDLIKLMKKPENAAQPGYFTPLSYEQLEWLNCQVRPIFEKQPSLVEMAAPISICGDIHGQYGDLMRIFDMHGWPNKTRYLFLGDYVDRGPHSIQTISLLFALKIRFPTHFYLLRGNHETRPINHTYGFKAEVKFRFFSLPDKAWKDLLESFNTTFDLLPLAALVSNRILCMHGGLSPDLTDLNQIRNLKRPLPVIPDKGLVCDLLWADPDKDAKGFTTNTRGISYSFGPDAVAEKVELLDLDMVARAHQVVNEGFEFFADNALVTLFSAPDYCGMYTNAGAVLSVDAKLSCKIKQIPSKYAKVVAKTPAASANSAKNTK